jgi:hypothetical protein
MNGCVGNVAASQQLQWCLRDVPARYYIRASTLTETLTNQHWLTVLHWAMAIPQSVNPPKSIAIVGGGTSGLGTLKALLDLPEEARRDWYIALYEQRSGIGGIW